MDQQLHELLSYDDINPFAKNDDLQKQIITCLGQVHDSGPSLRLGRLSHGDIAEDGACSAESLTRKTNTGRNCRLKKAVKETEDAFAITDKKEPGTETH